MPLHPNPSVSDNIVIQRAARLNTLLVHLAAEHGDAGTDHSIPGSCRGERYAVAFQATDQNNDSSDVWVGTVNGPERAAQMAERELIAGMQTLAMYDLDTLDGHLPVRYDVATVRTIVVFNTVPTISQEA